MRSPAPRPAPATWHLPAAGVVRLHRDPTALPDLGDGPGPNRFDDPRPRGSQDRYVMRYAATTLRGCLLESLDWLRVLDGEAAEREAAVIDDIEDSSLPPPTEAWQALEDYLTGRHLGVITGPGLQLVSINDPALQAELDQAAGVRALLDSQAGRAALLAVGAAASRRAHLDGAAVRLSSDLGRDLTRAASLALRDRPVPPDGIHYRSRHDDTEDCWALYDHAPVSVQDVQPFSPDDPDHQQAMKDVASLWDLALPPAWTRTEH